jgi:hypothetical protein
MKMESLTTSSSRSSSRGRIQKSSSTNSINSLFSNSSSISNNAAAASNDEKIGIDHSSLWYYDIIEKQQSERIMKRQKLKNRINRVFGRRSSIS